MRKFIFKPMPVLSVILVIGVSILIALGVWQFQRLQWKTALLAEVEASVTAPPLSSLADLSAAIDAEAPIDFRRVGFTASAQTNGPLFHLYKSQSAGIAWDVIEPLTENNLTILAKTEKLSDADKDKPRTEASPAPEFYTGYVRKVYEMGRIESWVKSKASPEANRYFHFNQTGDWYENLTGLILKGYYVEVAQAESADTLPVRRPDIRNNHFDYMLTWWSFALIFIVIYLILHKRAGRLKFI